MQYIADIIIVAVIIILTLKGIRDGFFYSIANFFSTIIAIILATVVSNPISQFLFDTFFRAGFENRIAKSLTLQGTETTITGVFESLPDFIVNLLADQGITAATVSANTEGTNEAIVESITNSVSAGIVMIVNFFVVIVLAILFLVILRIVIKIVNNAFRLPIIAQLNQALGGVFGFLFSLVVVFAVVSLLNFSLNLISVEWTKSISDALQNSILAEKIVANNPFVWIFQ